MTFSTFPQLAEAICTCAGVACPALDAGPDEVMAFHLTMGDVVVDFVHQPSPGNDEVFVLVTFGAIPEGQSHDVLRLMAEANFCVLSASAPVFGCNPDNGEVVLRQLILLSQAEATEVFEMVGRFVGLARDWRADPLLSPIQQASALAVPPHRFA